MRFIVYAVAVGLYGLTLYLLYVGIRERGPVGRAWTVLRIALAILLVSAGMAAVLIGIAGIALALVTGHANAHNTRSIVDFLGMSFAGLLAALAVAGTLVYTARFAVLSLAMVSLLGGIVLMWVAPGIPTALPAAPPAPPAEPRLSAQEQFDRARQLWPAALDCRWEPDMNRAATQLEVALSRVPPTETALRQEIQTHLDCLRAIRADPVPAVIETLRADAAPASGEALDPARSERVRAAAHYLRQLRGKARPAVDDLLRLVESRDVDAAAAAIEALLVIAPGDPRLEALVRRNSQAPEPHLRVNARYAARRLGIPLAPYLPR